MPGGPTQDTRLERSLGFARVLSQSVGVMAPAASIVFGLAFVVLYAGPASPIAMLVGAIGATLIAVCVGQLAKHISSAGGVYAFAATVFGDNVGFVLGWLYNVLYLMIICLVAISISLTGGDFLRFYFHLNAPHWLLSAALIAFTSTMAYIGVRPSTAVTVTLGVVEVLLLLAVALLLVVKAGHTNSVALFNPLRAAGASAGAARSLFLGVVFAFSLVSGFEAAVPLAEETRSARRLVPRAVVGSAAVIGLFYVVTTYAAAVGWGPGRLGSMIKSENPWREMAAHIGGGWALLVVLAILNSQIAGAQACFNASSRVLFASSRNRVLPAALARVHPRWRTPFIATIVTGIVVFAVTFSAQAGFHGARPAYLFFLVVITLVFLIVYVVVCAATIVFFRTKMRAEYNPVLHVVAPVLALCVLAPTFYYSLKGLTFPASAAIPAVLAWALVGVVVLIVLRARRVDISAEGERWLHDESAEPALR